MADRYQYEIAAKDQTKAAVRSATRGLSGLQNRIKTVDASMAKLTGGLAAVAGVAGLGAIVNQTRNSIDRLGKLSDQLGISAQAVNELTFAAGLAGVSQDQMAVALATVQKNAADAAAGTGEAKVAFQKLGISAADFASLPVDRQLAIIADRFGTVRSDAERTQIAMKLFGESGRALIPLLAGGSKGLDDTRKEARALGVTLRSNGVDSVEAMNDSFFKLSFAIRSRVMGALIDLAPTILALTDRTIEWVKVGLPEYLSRVNKAVSELTQTVSGKSGGLIGGLRGVWNLLNALVGEMTAWILVLTTGLGALANLHRVLGSLGLLFVGTSKVFDKFNKSLIMTSKVASESGKSTSVLKWHFQQLALAASELKAGVLQLLTTIKGLSATFWATGGAVTALLVVIGKLAQGFMRQRQQASNAKKATDELVDSIKNLAVEEQRVQLIQRQSNLLKQLEEIEEARRQAQESARKQIDALRGTVDGKEFINLSRGIKRAANEFQNAELANVKVQLDDIAVALENVNKQVNEQSEQATQGLINAATGVEISKGIQFTSEEIDNWFNKIREYYASIGTLAGAVDNAIANTRKGVAEPGLKPVPDVQGTQPTTGDKVVGQTLMTATNQVQEAWAVWQESMSASTGDIIRDSSIGWDMKLQEISRNWGKSMADASRNAVAKMGEFLNQLLIKLAQKAIFMFLANLANAFFPGAGSVINGVFGASTGSPSVGFSSGNRAAGAGNTVIFQSVLPPTQDDLRRASQTLQDSRTAYNRFALVS